MVARRILFLGGNGHCAARLAAARAALAQAGAELLDVAYPGFEGRPRARDLDDFFESIAASWPSRPEETPGPDDLVYATGIGGLIALALRAREDEISQAPLVLQAPVLWGLAHRVMPRVMRSRVARAAAVRLFRAEPFQRRFARTHFMRPLAPDLQEAFFDGYGRCGAFADLFAWFTPEYLDRLQRQLAEKPAALARITVWWGERDRVVTPGEMTWTEQALGARWPLRVFPGWGHYPMIDDPAGWARALR